jgi:hypothetical protein
MQSFLLKYPPFYSLWDSIRISPLGNSLFILDKINGKSEKEGLTRIFLPVDVTSSMV